MKLIACLPGKSYSGDFLKHWTRFVGQLAQNGISLSLSQSYSPNIYYSRNKCLLADIRGGRDQLPFKGEPYDYILWVDSDNIPSYENFSKLLARNVDIVAGYYKMENGEMAVVKKWDSTLLTSKGSMDFLQEEDFAGLTDLLPVSYAGMGFMLIKKGVYEKFSYPWFRPLNIDMGRLSDFTAEDVNFCLEAQAKGFTVYVDPLVRVGHEKTKIL